MTKDLLDSDSSGDESGGVPLTDETYFKINEDYARRFAYNKKREEFHRLEEKLGKPSLKRKREVDQDSSLAEETSSTESETEDDDGELVNEALDSEINKTLDAIRSKDPRVYDTTATFYTPLEDKPESKTVKDAKPMYLIDYHRKQLLNGSNGDESDTAPLRTYAEEQDALQRSVVREINAAAASYTNGVAIGEQGNSANDEDFLVMKQSKERKRIAPISSADVENADQDPETYLSNFMSSRAWIPTSKAQLQPFESDDEDEDRRAEEFEEVYNFRFEDPAKANEKLVSHARDVASKYSVRREETNLRQKRRDIEKERKEVLNQEHAEEKARYRRLKIEQLAGKLNKIKRAAGLKAQDLDEDDWARFLDDRWDNDRWEQEMQKRFGEAYYAEDDIGNDEDDQTHQLEERKSKLKKPKWDDDIDIKDLVPDFEEDEMPSFTLSDEDDNGNEMPSKDGSRGKKTSKGYKKELQDKKKIARKERRLIERLVDEKLEIDTAHLNGHARAGGFRYRDTSPVNYGLTARDILLAADSKLNEFAGLKKLAPYRPVEKKRKDRKHLGKKARLRKWRKETFGDEEGLTNVNLVYEAPVQDNKKAAENSDDQVTPAEEHLRKKRRR